MPKPPIRVGMTKKNIMIKAWAVTITLYHCSFPSTLSDWLNSYLIIPEKELPNRQLKRPNIKYSIPISLWLVDHIQRFFFGYFSTNIGTFPYLHYVSTSSRSQQRFPGSDEQCVPSKALFHLTILNQITIEFSFYGIFQGTHFL